VKSGGFPCRVAGCDVIFHVARGDSLELLRDASASRTAHEIAMHDYRHQIPAESKQISVPFTNMGKARRRPES
jgi:hypothetical protein